MSSSETSRRSRVMGGALGSYPRRSRAWKQDRDCSGWSVTITTWRSGHCAATSERKAAPNLSRYSGTLCWYLTSTLSTRFSEETLLSFGSIVFQTRKSDAGPQHLLHLALTPEPGDLVARAAEDVLDQGLADPALQVEAVSRSGSGGHRWMFHARTGPDTLNARSSGSATSSYPRCPSSVFRRRGVTLPQNARMPLLDAQPFRSRPTPVTINRMLMSHTKVRCEKRMWTWPPRNNPAATIGRAPAVDTSVSHLNRPRTTKAISRIPPSMRKLKAKVARNVLFSRSRRFR